MSLIEPESEELNPDKDYFSTPRQHHAVLVILCTASKHYFFTMEIYISTPRKTSTLTIIFFTLLGFFLSSAIYSKYTREIYKTVCNSQWSKLENAFNSKRVAYPSSLLDGGTEDGSGESDYEPFENLDWQSEYEARKIRLRQLCETEEFKPEFSVQDSWRNGSSPDVRFVVDENNKVLYCELPKVGCTNWKRTMLQLIQPKTFGKLAFDDIKGPHGHYGEEGYKYITEWPAEERLKMVDTFYKFIFVRHPLERILSAYRDKVQYDFLRNLPFQNPGKVKDHDADEFMDLDKEGFHAFVKYLTKRVDLAAGGSRIRHWKRYVDLCGICSFDWDFVGKLETVNEDSQFVLEDMKVSHLAEYPVKNRTTDHSMIIRYYKGLGRHWLDKLYETYKPDFDLFGYEIPHYLIDIQ